MKIVFLDVKTLGSDINLAGFEKMGEVIRYEISAPEDVPARVTDADVLIVNKVPINEATIGTAKNLKLVCLTATGTNNLDKSYLEKKGIEWRNVAGYSTEIVAQHTFAMVFYLMEKISAFVHKKTLQPFEQGGVLIVRFGICIPIWLHLQSTAHREKMKN